MVVKVSVIESKRDSATFGSSGSLVRSVELPGTRDVTAAVPAASRASFVPFITSYHHAESATCSCPSTGIIYTKVPGYL